MDIVNNVKSTHHRIRNSIATIIGIVVLAGCARNAPQDTWQPRGHNASVINHLQWIIFPMAGVVGVLVFAFAAYTFWKFKDRGQPIPSQSHGKPVV